MAEKVTGQIWSKQNGALFLHVSVPSCYKCQIFDEACLFTFIASTKDNFVLHKVVFPYVDITTDTNSPTKLFVFWRTDHFFALKSLPVHQRIYELSGSLKGPGKACN